MKAFKVIGIILLAILMCACVGVDCWYVAVLKLGPDKVVSNTYEIGLQTTTNGDTKYFAEINYFSNELKNGLEMLEIKFNYMLDERKEAFFSQGLQYVANDKNSALNFNYKTDPAQTENEVERVGGKGLYNEYNYYYYGSYEVSGGKKINYASSNNYETTTISTNPINPDTGFKIEIGDDLFLMKFRGKDKTHPQASFISSNVTKKTIFIKDTAYYYTYFDVNFFSQLMYRAAKNITPGTNQAIIFEFGDLFDYYKFDSSTNQYATEKYKACDSVIQELKSYYSLKINVTENGAQKSSDSLFNAIHGTSTYNLTDNYSTDDYFIGRTIINLTELDFSYVNVEGNNYAAKLKPSILKFYEDYNIYFNVVLNLDVLKENDINFVGLTNDNDFGNVNVLSFKTIETINGNIVEREIEL